MEEYGIEKVLYEHYRFVDGTSKRYTSPVRYRRNFKRFTPDTKGGYTVCRIVLDNGDNIMGIATCSRSDNFNYKLGRQIAFGRAMKKYQEYVELCCRP